jgi:hypothetical protein
MKGYKIVCINGIIIRCLRAGKAVEVIICYKNVHQIILRINNFKKGKFKLASSEYI